MLAGEHQFKNRTLPPVEHDVLWDADLSAAAAQVVGSLLEWPATDSSRGVRDTLRLIAQYYRIKNAETPSQAARENARKFDEAAEALDSCKALKIKAGKELADLAAGGFKFVGDPVGDWRQARRVLQEIKALNELFREARMVRMFRATDALGSGLSELWLSQGHYAGASDLVKRILDRERLLAADRDPQGYVLMTIHKAKGKEFDGVVLVEGAFVSQFFDTTREQPPYQRSRRLLRVGITRSRSRVTIVRPKAQHLSLETKPNISPMLCCSVCPMVGIVESRKGSTALTLRFPSPLVKPDAGFRRIRLSDRVDVRLTGLRGRFGVG
jgi:DNA helicase-2/ATP-dependent DNA helicase PcrA